MFLSVESLLYRFGGLFNDQLIKNKKYEEDIINHYSSV